MRDTHFLSGTEGGTGEDTQRQRPRRGTHYLETGEGWTCHGTERNRQSEVYPHPADGRWRDLSGHREKQTEQGTLTDWKQQRGGLVNTEKNRPSEAHSLSGDGGRRDSSENGKKPTDRGALTFWTRQREGLISTRKETDRTRRTHKLETAEGETCQETEINRPNEAHSQPEDGRGRDSSEHGKKSTEQGALTSWRRQGERLVRKRKETD